MITGQLKRMNRLITESRRARPKVGHPLVKGWQITGSDHRLLKPRIAQNESPRRRLNEKSWEASPHALRLRAMLNSRSGNAHVHCGGDALITFPFLRSY